MQTESPRTPKPGPKLCHSRGRFSEAGKQGVKGLVKSMLLSQAELCSSSAYLGGLSRNSAYEALVLVHFSLYPSQSK